MLTLSDTPIEPVISTLAKYGIEAGYLVPTETGLEKSILDAHAGLRDYFRLTKFHNYQLQTQGSLGKRIVKAYFVTSQGVEPTQASLYRPETKYGDPRIWIYGLKDRVKAGNLLANFIYKDELYIVNVSDKSMLSITGDVHPFFRDLINHIVGASNVVAMELLGGLRDIARSGWVNSMRSGPTGVGYTLETLLGIAANNNQSPDYKGIEIKASRVRDGRQLSRTTLFSKTPDWKRSAVSNGLGLLNAYGYRVNERLQLYCSLNHRPNSLGHYLNVQDDDLILHSMYKQSGDGSTEKKVLLWDIDQLRSSLSIKHPETFWVKANVRYDSSGKEQFQYTDVVHTKGPLLGNMVEMFRLGHMYLDYTIHEEFRKNGKQKSRDHGYLFKIWQNKLPSLFPPSKTYSLI